MPLPPVFIRSATAVSPQKSFGEARQDFLKPALGTDSGMLHVQDAPYQQYINPVAIRRMSRALKFAISAGLECLKSAGVATPDAIVVGTGNGSVSDMQSFLMDMIRLEEETLNPTAFIQSTYNSVNGWLAISARCTGYNQAYVHRGASLELALQDAQMLMAEGDAATVLAGCFDELTTSYALVKSKVNYWQTPPPADSLSLLENPPREGSIGGEGSAFFLLSNDAAGAGATLVAIAVIQPDAYLQKQNEAVLAFLKEHHLQPEDVDLLVSGWNGNARWQPFYQSLHEAFAAGAIAGYKHLCGEYDTASGFALWLACELLNGRANDGMLFLKPAPGKAFRRALLVNHSVMGEITVMLVEGAA